MAKIDEIQQLPKIEQCIQYTLLMAAIATEIQHKESELNEIPARGQRFGLKPFEISGMMQNANDEIAYLIKQYRECGKLQSEAMRSFEIRNSKPVDFTFNRNGSGFAMSAHNFNVIRDYSADQNFAS